MINQGLCGVQWEFLGQDKSSQGSMCETHAEVACEGLRCSGQEQLKLLHSAPAYLEKGQSPTMEVGFQSFWTLVTLVILQC